MRQFLLSVFAFVLLGASSVRSKEFDEETRTKTFDFYWTTLAKKYPYFDVQGVDWNLARLTHRQRALEANYHLIRPESSPPHRQMKFPKEQWIRARTFGDLGYLALLTFSPKMTKEGCTVSQMRQIFLDAIEEIVETKKLIVDMRYNGEVVVLTNEFSGSGGEWFPAFMQHYGRATLVGGITRGAEGGVMRVQGPDGSTLSFGFNHLKKEGFTFQRNGVRPDHWNAIPASCRSPSRTSPRGAAFLGWLKV